MSTSTAMSSALTYARLEQSLLALLDNLPKILLPSTNPFHCQKVRRAIHMAIARTQWAASGKDNSTPVQLKRKLEEHIDSINEDFRGRPGVILPPEPTTNNLKQAGHQVSTKGDQNDLGLVDGSPLEQTNERVYTAAEVFAMGREQAKRLAAEREKKATEQQQALPAGQLSRRSPRALKPTAKATAAAAEVATSKTAVSSRRNTANTLTTVRDARVKKTVAPAKHAKTTALAARIDALDGDMGVHVAAAALLSFAQNTSPVQQQREGSGDGALSAVPVLSGSSEELFMMGVRYAWELRGRADFEGEGFVESVRGRMGKARGFWDVV